MLAAEPAVLAGAGALPEVAGNAEEVAGATAETVCETPDVADATGAELAAAELVVAEPVVAGGVPEPLLPVLGAPVGELVVAAVTAEVTDAVADVTAEVPETGDDAPGVAGEADACAGVTGGEAKVAAFACRENTRKIRKSPAATMANCTARRAMRPTITGCGMSSSHPPGTRTWPPCPRSAP